MIHGMSNQLKANLIGVAIGTLFFVFLFAIAYNGVNTEHQESYQAWIKQTGNPKDLTFDEFVALSRTGFFGPK